jgi:carbon monoxide dehydrogenase subunit G
MNQGAEGEAMKLEGEVTIQARREKVWDFLLDIEAMSACIPGLESLEAVVPFRKYQATASVGLGTVKVRFNADVEWLELERPTRALMKGHGTAPGSVGDATAEMVLSDGPDDSTTLTWWADVVVSGTIASLASRLMGSVTKKLTASFFDCVKKQIED